MLLCSPARIRNVSQALCAMSTVSGSVSAKQDSLKRFIVDKIRATGPITVAEYMKTAVSAPTVGFYGNYDENSKQIFGSAGDFITAPELTQLFGEMIGVWIYYELANAGYNGNSRFRPFGRNIGLSNQSTRAYYLCGQQYVILENGPVVKQNKSRTGVPVYWYKNLDDVPEAFSVFVANEFLDALPIHQFVKGRNNMWHEVYINIDTKNELVFMNSKGENIHTRGLLKESIRNESARNCWEISPEAGTYVNQVAERVTYNGGFGLIIDYGHNGTRNDLSLRAYSQHKQVHPLSRPGAIDLTADVDFWHLTKLIEDRTIVFGPQTQREFLAQLGIELRLRRLLQSCKEEHKKKAIIEAFNYLMGEMGLKFFLMSFFPKTLGGILGKRGGPAGFVQKQS